MKIVADANILDVDQEFARYGELHLLPGREISAHDVRDADALIVRSITPVNRQLLEGSSVRFVATATSGTDHLDLDWLRSAGITVADAPGSNANAVAAYVGAALRELADAGQQSLRGRSCVIIGAGHVGSRVLRSLHGMGVRCQVCDPQVERVGPAEDVLRDLGRTLPPLDFCTLDATARADIVSLHVPLVRGGEYPTPNLLDRQRIMGLRPGTVLINTARGDVLEESALKERLQRRGDLTTVLDVFAGEPEIDRELIDLATIATPHVAGYSAAAKRAATQRILQAFRRHFGFPGGSREERDPLEQAEPLPSPAQLSMAFRAAVRQVPEGQSLAPAFDALRRARLGAH